MVAMAEVGDVELAYATYGRASDPAMVLIRGLGTQMIEWPEALVEGFVAAGLRVVTFDNRDVGLSSKRADGDPPCNSFSCATVTSP